MPGGFITAVSEDIITQDFLVVRFPQANHRALQEEVLGFDVLQPHSVTDKVHYFISVNFPLNSTLVLLDSFFY